VKGWYCGVYTLPSRIVLTGRLGIMKYNASLAYHPPIFGVEHGHISEV
jgi:hypothetical protein